jgi:hypothetical protein
VISLLSNACEGDHDSTCPACNAVAGSDPNRQDRLVWSFMNQVARGVQAEVTGSRILLYAPYYELTQPPPDVKIEPNIIAVSCRSYSWDAASGQTPGDFFPTLPRVGRAHAGGRRGSPST